MTDVVDPGTGEVLERLETAPTEVLAAFYASIRERQAQLEDMRRAVKAELQNRLAVREVAVMTAGDYEIGERHGRKSVWDGEALEAVVRDLIDAGAIQARDVTGLIRHDVSVNGHLANSLSRRLVGANKRAVEECRTWETERRAFDVVVSQPLLQPPSEGES
jgi:hypothetical protein